MNDRQIDRNVINVLQKAGWIIENFKENCSMDPDYAWPDDECHNFTASKDGYRFYFSFSKLQLEKSK